MFFVLGYLTHLILLINKESPQNYFQKNLVKFQSKNKWKNLFEMCNFAQAVVRTSGGFHFNQRRKQQRLRERERQCSSCGSEVVVLVHAKAIWVRWQTATLERRKNLKLLLQFMLHPIPLCAVNYRVLYHCYRCRHCCLKILVSYLLEEIIFGCKIDHSTRRKYLVNLNKLASNLF